MSGLDMKWANELRHSGKNIGRAGLSEAVIEAVASFDGSYKGAMVLAGKLKAISQAAKFDGYWSEKVDDGYQLQRHVLSASKPKHVEEHR
jgi:hypothetical protein